MEETVSKKEFMGTDYYSENELREFNFKEIGKNVLIKKNVTIYYPRNIILKDNVRIEDFVVIVASQEECVFHHNTHIASHCVLLAKSGVEMHPFSTLAPHCVLVTASDDYSGEKLTSSTIPIQYRGGEEGKIVLKKHVILGTRVTIFPGVVLENGVAVGAHSLVKNSLKEWTVFAGNPLKELYSRKHNLLELEKQYLEELKNGQ